MNRNSVLGIVASLLAFTVPSLSQPSHPPPSELDNILRWLPTDTETVSVGQGPFRFPKGNQSTEANKSVDSRQLRAGLELRVLQLFYLADENVSLHVGSSDVAWAVESARHFRQPADLGAMLYQGCTVAVFTKPVSTADYAGWFQGQKVRFEEIQGIKAAIVSKRLESDTWTIYIAQPKPTVLIAATDRHYLSEVLDRIRTTKSDRALPTTLPEWKYLDVKAPFWSLRHYDNSQRESDPTSGANDGVVEGDPKAIGLSFSFDPEKSPKATVHYLSADTNLQPKLDAMKETLKGMSGGTDPADAASLVPTTEQVAPGVYRLQFEIRSRHAAAMVQFVVDAWLGHAVLL